MNRKIIRACAISLLAACSRPLDASHELADPPDQHAAEAAHQEAGELAARDRHADHARGGHGRTVATPETLAIKFCDNRPFVTSTIIGASTMDQLKADIDAFDFEWTQELETAVDALHVQQPNPCP